jgi:hypothetical protein
MDLFLQIIRTGAVVTSALAVAITFFGILLAGVEGAHLPTVAAFKRVAMALLFLVLAELCVAGFTVLFIQGGG